MREIFLEVIQSSTYLANIHDEKVCVLSGTRVSIEIKKEDWNFEFQWGNFASKMNDSVT
jgi:hypothetical protein